MIRALVCLTLWLSSAPVWAHKPSDSYLSLHVHGSQIRGQWDIALRDLDYAIGLDRDGDGAITWGELRSRHAALATYALSRLALNGDDARCETLAREQRVDYHSDGAYAVLRFQADCGRAPGSLSLHYDLFFDLDPQHRGLLRLESEGLTRTAIFSPERRVQRLDLALASSWDPLLDYAREGMWHIWVGYDHILFLVSLLLPAVLRREAGRWQALSDFPAAFWDVLKIVTAFTVAHSITLSLAALGVIALPARWVESAIAASVVLAALNNLYPLFQQRWRVAFAFGLVHGLGFANVLMDLGLPRNALLVALLGFNLGVEAGQFLIVAGLLPLAYGLRHSWFYRRLTLVPGSLLIAGVAFLWLLERSLDLRLLAP